jgi:ParB-like chromosome segregation protein Spo0J
MSTASDREKGIRRFDVALDRIRTDGGTQMRNRLDPEVVDEYAEKMAAGVKFPAICLVQDTADEGVYWLVDGFYRTAAARKAGEVKRLPAVVYRGDQRTARYMGLAANKEHGARRDAGTVKRAVLAMVEDKEWGKLSAAKIAEHVGTSTRYVEQVISAHSDELAGEGKKPPERSPVRTVTRKRGGKETTFEMKVGKIGKQSKREAEERRDEAAAETNGEQQQAEETFPETIEDHKGNTITDPEVVRAYTIGREEIRGLIGALKPHLEKIEKRVEDKAEGWGMASTRQLPASIADLRHDLKAALPVSVCPMHAQDPTARKDCVHCLGVGYLSEQKLKAALAAKNSGKDKTEEADAKFPDRREAQAAGKDGK